MVEVEFNPAHQSTQLGGEKCDFTTFKESEADRRGEKSTPHYFRLGAYFLFHYVLFCSRLIFILTTYKTTD